MIMSQEQAFLKAYSQLQAMCELVAKAGQQGWRVDEVERAVFSQLMAAGLTLLQGFARTAGEGDAGPTLEAAEGHTLKRLEERRSRRYLSIFGELEIPRWVYARREGQKIERVPLDERLGLPAGEFSYVLEDWLQRICIQESFDESVGSLRDLLGVAPSSRAAEVMNQRMAEHAEAFRWSQSAPPQEEEAEILVATADGKGVPMRRPLEERVRTGPRRGRGEKANKKQMSYVGAVYSIAAFGRSAEEVLDELQRRERSAQRPRPQHKTVWAEMTTTLEGEACTGRERLFIEMAVACHERDRERQKPLVCLMDGEASLWQMRARVAAAGRRHPGSVPCAGAAVGCGPLFPPGEEPRGRGVCDAPFADAAGRSRRLCHRRPAAIAQELRVARRETSYGDRLHWLL